MIRFLNLEAEGFCSIGSLSLPLDTPSHITLIKSPNGFGKTSILSALTWALYGKSLKGVSSVNTWKSVQPKGYLGTKVEVYFQGSCDHVYKVIRCQQYKAKIDDGAMGNDRLLLLVDGHLSAIKGKIQSQEAINRALGMSYTLFMNSIIFGQGMKRLAQESNADKKKLFEEAFGIEFINQAKELAQEKYYELDSIASKLRYESNSLERELSTNREAYRDLKAKEKAFTENVEMEKKSLEQEKSQLTKLLIQTQNRIKEQVEASVDIKINNQNKKLADIKVKLKEAKNISNTPLKQVIEYLISMLESGKYQEALEKTKLVYKAFIDIEKYDSEYSKGLSRLRELENLQLRYEKLSSECTELAAKRSRIDQELDRLAKEKLSVISPKYKQKLRSIKKNLKEVHSELSSNSEMLQNYSWLISDPLGNNGIKAYLFDSSLAFLNRTLDSYAEVLGFRIEFNVDLGSARKEFVTLIERDGHIIDYDELSGGEKQLVSVAMAFAMNESLTASTGVNIAFLDEVFESLSSDNIEVVTSLIKHIFKDKSLFLITHIDSLSLGNTKTLVIDKVSGISHYRLL